MNRCHICDLYSGCQLFFFFFFYSSLSPSFFPISPFSLSLCQFSSGVRSSDLQTVRDNVSVWSSSKASEGPSANSADVSVSIRASASASHSVSASVGPLPVSKGAPRMIGPSMGPVRSGAKCWRALVLSLAPH